MSHNTFASSGSGVVGIGSGSIIVKGRTIYGTIRDNNSLNFSQSWDSQTAYLYDGDLTSMCFSTNAGISKGAYISFTVSFSQSLGSSFSGFSGDNNIGLVNQTIETELETAATGNYVTKVSLTYFNNGGNNSYFCLNPSNGQYIAYNNVNFNRLSVQISPISWYYNDPYSESLESISSKLNNQSQDTADAINDSQEQATQDASDAAEDSADDAQADNEAATSSLLSVITGFFGAMANLNPTNCKFDSHLPFLSGNGQIDLCQVPAPPVVQAIGSLILIGIMVPFAIHMYNRFISITGSFQR